jgi:hypothetical protein
MTLDQFLRQAKVGDSITIGRTNPNTGLTDTIDGTVTGLHVSCEPIDVSTGTHHRYMAGPRTIVVTLDPWWVDITLTPNDTLRVMEP